MLKKLLKKVTPPKAVFLFRKIKGRVLYGGNTYFCSVCESRSRIFLPRPDQGRIMCPVCLSLQRHRVLIRYWKQATELFNPPGKRLLHVAPEPCLLNIFQKHPNIEYSSADLDSMWADIKADVTDLPFEDSSFDVIICNHVLEHVPDDRKAMSEFYRVLAPGGWATLQVPIQRETTFEDPTVTSPEERLTVFGQDDHVRIYGKDYFDRLKEAGFVIETIPASKIFTKEQMAEMVLDGVEDVIIAKKAMS